jgi:CRISPR-associated endonuclease/helicase Cas3
MCSKIQISIWLKRVTMNVIDSYYQAIVHTEPYPHQVEAYKALEAGQSVILRAPTGSGKSEAAFVPFLNLKGKSLPNRMIYTLPMRALVNSLHERFTRYAPHLDIKAQHGERPENVLFDADCIVAMLDQVITSYACAPLSLGIKHENIPAGVRWMKY